MIRGLLHQLGILYSPSLALEAAMRGRGEAFLASYHSSQAEFEACVAAGEDPLAIVLAFPAEHPDTWARFNAINARAIWSWGETESLPPD